MTQFMIGLACLGIFIIGYLFVLGICAVASAADDRMEELLRDGHEHY